MPISGFILHPKMVTVNLGVNGVWRLNGSQLPYIVAWRNWELMDMGILT
jgi:hypothetical protein